MTIEFEILSLPKTPNQLLGQHWTTRHTHAKRWKRLVGLELLSINQPVIGLKLTKASLTLTRHSSRETDTDNLAGSFKHVIDALVKHQVIIDDKPSVIGSPTFKWIKAPPKQGKITVKIESETL